MINYCILVCNGTRARFFSIESTNLTNPLVGPRLVEQQDLANTEASTAGKDTWTDLKSGRNTASGGGPAHGYDDHRDQHEEEFMRRFAGDVAAEAMRLIPEKKTTCLIIVAGHRMLGLLRNAMEIPTTDHVEVKEVAKDLVRFSAQDIHEYLSSAGLLPARKKVTA